MPHSKRSVNGFMLFAAAFTALAATSGAARANLALTAAGVSGGFKLDTSSSGYKDTNGNGTGVGPLSVGFTAGGGMVVGYYSNDSLVVYNSDANNQTVANNGTVVSGFPTITGIVTIGGYIYAADQGAGSILKLNPNGTLNSTLTTGLGPATGMAVNPNTGHIYVSNISGTIFNVDPVTGAKVPFITGISAGYAPDGLSVSPDGKILFGEINQHIVGFDTATAAQVFDSGLIPLADGAAAASGVLAGNLVVNTNDGNVYQVDEKTGTKTLIATGGSRGDLVTVDPHDDTLLLSQSNSIERLTLPAGSVFIPAPNTGIAAVPEPASLGLLGAGAAIMAFCRRRKPCGL